MSQNIFILIHELHPPCVPAVIELAMGQPSSDDGRACHGLAEF